MATWRLSAGHTHLYPGVAPCIIDAPGGRSQPAAGDDVVIEFADGHAAAGEISARAGLWLLAAAHVTAAGTRIAARRWRLEAAPDGARVLKLRSPTSGRARTGG